MRDGARVVGPNAAVSKEDEEAFDFLEKRYTIEFRLVPTATSYYWRDVK